MKNLIKKEINIVIDGVNFISKNRRNFYGYATFESMSQLLHYFNIAANPNNCLFDVPNFDLGDISCINDSSNTIYFWNLKGFNDFIKIVEAQRDDNVKFSNNK